MPPARLPSRLVLPALCIALAAGATLVLSGFGYRWGMWSVTTAFAMFRAVVFVGGAAAVLALAGLALALVHRRGATAAVAVAALLIGAVSVAVPIGFARRAAAVPPIHDITTDIAHPPPFVALRQAREAAPNGADYGGRAVSAQQERAYADLAPLRFTAAPERVFAAVVAAARESGWAVAAAVPGEGRFEATATTPWFGFKDDIVIRVAAEAGGTKVDVGSASRVGRSDLGVNAQRIRAFTRALRRLSIKRVFVSPAHRCARRPPRRGRGTRRRPHRDRRGPRGRGRRRAGPGRGG
jgi:uncharacterized protein (DUF1499 family)